MPTAFFMNTGERREERENRKENIEYRITNPEFRILKG